MEWKEETMEKIPAGACCTFAEEGKNGTRYRFCRGEELLGSAAIQSGRNFPLVIQSNGLILNSTFDPDKTIVSGDCREIVDADSGEVYGRLIWLGAEAYRLVLNWDSGSVAVDIRCRGAGYVCSINGTTVARTIPVPKRPQRGDWKLHRCMALEEPLPDALTVMLLSISLLRFAR